MEKEINEFLNELTGEEKSEGTIDTYRYCLNNFLEWFYNSYGDTDINLVAPQDLKAYKIQYMQERLKRKPTTVNKTLVVLKSFFNWAQEMKYLDDNPAKKLKYEDKQKVSPKWLTWNEQNRLLRAVHMAKNQFKRVRDEAIIRIMLQAGLRVDEVSSLDIEDIKLRGRSGDVIVQKGKGRKYREVPLNKDLRNVLSEYLGHRNYHKYAGSRYFFISERNKKLTPRGIQHMVMKYAGWAGFEKGEVTPHTLRHTFCHNLIAAGESIDKVADLAGHESIDTTRIYTTSGVTERREAVEKLNEAE